MPRGARAAIAVTPTGAMSFMIVIAGTRPATRGSHAISGRRSALHGVRLPPLELGLLEYRRVDGSARPIALQHLRNLLADAALARRVEARRGGGDVRGEDHLVHLEQRVVRVRRLNLEHIETGAGDPPLLERLDQRGLIDGGTPPSVDEHGG